VPSRARGQAVAKELKHSMMAAPRSARTRLTRSCSMCLKSAATCDRPQPAMSSGRRSEDPADRGPRCLGDLDAFLCQRVGTKDRGKASLPDRVIPAGCGKAHAETLGHPTNRSHDASEACRACRSIAIATTTLPSASRQPRPKTIRLAAAPMAHKR